MPKAKLICAAFALLAAAAAGCAGPTAQDLRTEEDAREQAARLIESFGQAVRGKAPELIRPYLLADLKPREVSALEGRLAQASWLERYSGYRPDAARALAGMGWRDWERPEVVIEVPGTAAHGQTTLDELKLGRAGDDWRIEDFAMAEPRPGDFLDPPVQVRDQIEPKARQIMLDLRERRLSTVMYALPQEQASRYRPARVSWWRELLGATPDAMSVLGDLETMSEFTILAWPDPKAPSEFVYDSPNTVAVLYGLYYVWLEGGVSEMDILRMKLVFLKTSEGWALFTVRLSAQGIPYS